MSFLDWYFILFGILFIGIGIFAKSGYREGRFGQGELLKPQWKGRLWFSFVGVLFVLAGLFWNPK